MLNAITDDPAPRAAIEQASHMLKGIVILRAERISSNWYKNNNMLEAKGMECNSKISKISER
jgi:hypothetical protein